MRLDRDMVLNLLAGLIVLALGAWLVANTEWVEQEVPVHAQGEAAKDQHYAAKKIIQRLGGKVESPINLDRLPPQGAVLVLNSWSWDLFPEREEKLRRWVEDGGHLVIQAYQIPKWAPLERKNVNRKARERAKHREDEDEEEDDEEAGDETPEPAPAAAPAPPPPPAPASAPREAARPPLGPLGFRRPVMCRQVTEGGTQPAYGDARTYKLCNGGMGSFLVGKSAVQWALSDMHGPVVMRVAHGRGTVSATHGDWGDNRDIFEGDNALAYMGTLQMRPGRELWFVSEEARLPLTKLIWQTGAPAVLLFGLLLGLILWRGGFRFGPRAPVPPLARRSVAEQIRGTAGFIFQRDATALHRAQLRVLEQAARRSIRDHDRLELRARAEAIAKATALSADDLARAMNPSLKRTPRELLATLTLLETAARRLTLNR